jgi:hypothetical protein
MITDHFSFIRMSNRDSELLSIGHFKLNAITKALIDNNYTLFPFISRQKFVVAARNGTFNIETCVFTAAKDVVIEPTHCECLTDNWVDASKIIRGAKCQHKLSVPSHFLDGEFDLENTATPLYDSILEFQYGESDECAEIIKFFKLQVGVAQFPTDYGKKYERVVFLLGYGGNGKSTLAFCTSALHRNYGVFCSTFEAKYDITVLYNYM